MEKIEIGVITKAHGIMGEMKMKPYVDGFSSIAQIKNVEIEGKIYHIKRLTNSQDGYILGFKEITSRNEAELFRGLLVYCDKNDIVKDENSFFIVDIIGCEVYLTSGKLIGKIIDVKSSNVDIFEMETNEGTAYFPHLKDLVESVDVKNRKIILNAKRFTEVVCYED